MTIHTAVSFPTIGAGDLVHSHREMTFAVKLRFNAQFGDYLCAVMLRGADGKWEFAKNLVEFTAAGVDAMGVREFLLQRIVAPLNAWLAETFPAGAGDIGDPALPASEAAAVELDRMLQTVQFAAAADGTLRAYL